MFDELLKRHCIMEYVVAGPKQSTYEEINPEKSNKRLAFENVRPARVVSKETLPWTPEDKYLLMSTA